MLETVFGLSNLLQAPGEIKGGGFRKGFLVGPGLENHPAPGRKRPAMGEVKMEPAAANGLQFVEMGQQGKIRGVVQDGQARSVVELELGALS